MSLVDAQFKAGKIPTDPRAEIPQKHLHAVLFEDWSDSQEVIESKGVLVSATTFKMDRKDRRIEVLASGKPAVVIVGSFRFKDEIDKAIDDFEAKGIQVLMPPRGQVAGMAGEFPLLAGDDPSMPPAVIEDFFIQNLQAADVGYIVNPGGYIGDMSTIEIGLAMKTGVPLYSSEPVDMDRVPDYAWKPTVGLIKPYGLDSLIQMVATDTYDTDDYPWFRPWSNMGTYRPAPNLDRMMLRERQINI